MKDQRFRKLLDAILVPLLAVLSGLVVMGILILLLKKPLLNPMPLFFPMDLAAGNTVTAFSLRHLNA